MLSSAMTPATARLALLAGGMLRVVGVATRSYSVVAGADSWIVPQWSPNGSMLLYAARGGEGELHLTLVRADGSDARRLVASPGHELSASWSPDGTAVAFSRLQLRPGEIDAVQCH